MVETDGIHDVSNETELTVKQRSLVNRQLNGTNGTIENSISKANKDPPKNLVNFFLCFFFHTQFNINALTNLLYICFILNRHIFFYLSLSLNMCLHHTFNIHSRQTHRGRLMISFGKMYYSSFICIWVHFMDYIKYSPDNVKLQQY